MMSAAVRSSFFVFRIRPVGCSSVSVGSPLTRGITATPVSKPERPSASFGKSRAARAIIITGLPCAANSADRQLARTSGWAATSRRPVMMTTTLSIRYVATSPTASTMASWKPRRKMAPSTVSSPIVTSIGWSIQAGVSGFSMRCALASAADRVMVITKSVAAKPRRHRTTSLPFQRGKSCSSMKMLPCPCGLTAATRLYMGSAPKIVTRMRTSVASGASAPAARNAMLGW